MNIYAHRFAVVAIVALTALVYFNSSRNSFVWDDALVITRNDFVKKWDNLPRLFTPEYLTQRKDVSLLGRKEIGSGESSYRPVSTLSYFLLYEFFGDRPQGYHWASILLHALNACLLYFYTLPFFKRAWPALLASLFFAVYPVHAEAVNVVSFNEDLLAFAFGIGSLLLFRSRHIVLAAGLYFFACFSKEMAVTVPLLASAYEYFFVCQGRFREWRGRWRAYLGYAAVAVFYLWARFFVFLNPSGDGGYEGGSIWTAVKMIGNYLAWLVWPVGIHSTLQGDPTFAVVSAWDPAFWSSVIGLLGMIFVAFFYRNASRLVRFGIIWFFIALLPVLPISMNYLASRYLYLPSLGFFLVLAYVFERLSARSVKLMQAGAFILLVACSGQTFINGFLWRNNIALFSQMTKDYPHNAVGHSWLAQHYKELYAFDLAIEEYKIAVELDPSYEDDRLGLAECQLGVGKAAEAAGVLRETLLLNPRSGRAYELLALALVKQSDTAGAIETYRKALAINPDSPEALDGLGVTYANMGRTREAEEAWRKALAVDPEFQPSRKNLERFLQDASAG